MTSFLFVKPAVDGAVVRRPESGRPIAETGERVVDGPFWRRRLAQGDVVEAPDTTPAKKEA